MDYKNKKEVEHEVDQPSAEENAGGRGNNSSNRKNKYGVIVAVAIIVLFAIAVLVSC